MDTERFDRLTGILRGLGSIVIAVSGGLDSGFLLLAAARSGARVLGVTTVSETTPERDRADAALVSAFAGAEHRVIESSEMDEERFVENTPDRCYHCKNILFTALREIADNEGYAWVADGATRDDLRDYRPGLRAAELHGIRHPLIEAGYTKAEVRAASRALALPIAEKPASPCLSSRLPYGTRITRERLSRVGQAEEFIRSLGASDVRVRDHDGVARIEVPCEDREIIVHNAAAIATRLREFGFAYVSMDLEGLRSGSLNRAIGR
jgi:uncharacterized protein